MAAFGGRRRLSELRPLAWDWRLPAVSVGLLAGEFAAAGGGRWAWRCVASVALAAPFVARRHRGAFEFAVLAGAAATIGLLLGWPGAAPPRSAEESAGQRLLVVVADAKPVPGFGGRPAASLVVDVESLVEGPGSVRPGDRLRLRVWDVARPWEPGDRIEVRVAARRPRGTCNDDRDAVAETAARAGIAWFAESGDDLSFESFGRASGLGVAIARARRRIARAIDASVDPVVAPVVRSIVVGDPYGLEPELRQAYALTGTAHVLSVSGLHVAIVAGTSAAVLRLALAGSLRFALRFAAARIAALLTMLPAFAYVALAGAEVPAVRSLAAGAAVLGAAALGRRSDPKSALGAGALWIGVSDPRACLDPSFQLSFGAVIAIGAGVRAIRRGALGRWVAAPPTAGPGRHVAAMAASSIAVSLCAALGTAPITAMHFGRISAVGVLANLAVVPLVGTVALVVALLGAALLPVVPGVAAIAFGIAGRIVAVANAIVLAVAGVPGASIRVTPPSVAATCGWLLAVAGFAVAPGRRRQACLAFGLLLAGLSSIAPGSVFEANEIRVAFLDVGQGDATLVESGGGAWLVDAGGSTSEARPESSPTLSELRRRGIARLDGIAITHPQADHEGGLDAVVAAVEVAFVGSNGSSSGSRGHAAVVADLDQRGIRRSDLRRGSRTPDHGPEVLAPRAGAATGDGNDDSLVLRFARGATSLLLPGDVEAAAERRLLRDGLPGTLLVRAPHHGSRTSSGTAFVDALRPSVVVAGTGWRNRFGLPSPEVPGRWESRGALWLDTAADGEVVVSGDGQLAVLETCRRRE